MAADPALDAALEAAVLDRRPSARRRRWSAACGVHADAIAALPDPTLAARADDVRSLGRRAARLQLRGSSGTPSRTDTRDAARAPSILVADDLGPADVAELDPAVAGIALAGGAPTAHAAVVARGLGMPMAVGLGAGALALPGGARARARRRAPATLARRARRGPRRGRAGRPGTAARASARPPRPPPALPAVTADGVACACSSTPPRPPRCGRACAAGAEGDRPAAHRARVPRRGRLADRGRAPRRARARAGAARRPHRDRARARLRRRQDAAVPARHRRCAGSRCCSGTPASSRRSCARSPPPARRTELRVLLPLVESADPDRGGPALLLGGGRRSSAR